VPQRLQRTLRDRRQQRLLRAARRGDPKALRQLYRELWTPLRRYVAARPLSQEDAEDLCAQVFLRFLEKLADYDPARGAVQAWLLGIARHALLDHYRRLPPDRAQAEPLEALARHAGDPSPDPLDAMIADEDARLLHGALAGQPADVRELFALRYAQGLSHREIAAVTGLGESAVRQRFSRTLRELRTLGERAKPRNPRGNNEEVNHA
jgi:RNA polymerase sigma-70 factor (ECF subfamily)